MQELAAFGLVALIFGATFGAVAAAAGMPTGLTLATSALVFGGAAQLSMLGILTTGGSALAAIAAGLALNARFGAMAMAIGRRLQASVPRRLAMASIVVDPSVAVVLRDRAPQATKAFVLAGVATLVPWVAGTYLGIVAGSLLKSPETVGLDAALPVLLLALLAPLLRRPSTRWSALLGGCLAVALATQIGSGWAILFAPIGAVVARRVVPLSGTPEP